MNSKTVNIILIVAVAVLAIFLWRSCEERSDTRSTVSALKDSLRTTTDEMGRQIAKREAIVADKQEAMRIMELSHDSTVQKLRSVIEETKADLRQATVLLNETRDSAREESDVVHRTDTVVVEKDTTFYPTYKADWQKDWSEGSIVARHDSISRDITLFNEYRIKTVKKRTGLLKPSKTEFQVKNMNPNTRTVDMRTYTVPCRCNKGLYLGGGLAVGLLGGLLIE